MRIRLQADSIRPLLAIFLLSVLSGNVLATPQPPPLLCVDGDECVETPFTPPPASGDGYTLASIGTVPFTYQTPVPPTITSEATVTPATIEANKVNGRRLILSPGNYGDQRFSTQDQEIVFQNGVVFGFLNVDASASRLVFRGEPARAGVTGYIRVGSSSGAATDIVFDGITQIHIQEGGQYPRQENMFNANRMAIMNSSIQAYGFVFLSYSGSNNRLQNVIIANNNMVDEGTSLPGTGLGQATLRTQGASRIIFVDNRLVGDVDDGFHNFRIHAQPDLDAEYFYIARNQFEGTGHAFYRSGDGQSTREIRNVWFENNTQYTTRLSPINVGSGMSDYPTSFTMRNNTIYSSVGGWPSIPSAVSSASGYNWSVSGNSVESYRTPAAWQFR